MGTRWLVLHFLVLSLFISCKREKYDPSKYDDLLYSYTPPPAATKAYIFQATVGGEQWNTTGLALVNQDTMVVSGTVGTQTLSIKLAGFSSRTTFTISTGKDSASLSTVGNATFDYASISNASGNVTITKLDQAYDQIEANFTMVLYSEAGDSMVVTDGYFKISYTSDDIRWTEGGKILVADSVWATFISASNSFEVYGLDTNTKKMIKLVVPKQPQNGLDSDAPLSTNETTQEAYYTVPTATGSPLKASSGALQLHSSTGNIVKGVFGQSGSIKFGTKSPNLFFVSKGTYSAKY